MKRSFYLFNPGIMERKDNTLKFTPVVVNEDNTEIKQQPRYIPIEDVADSIGMYRGCCLISVLSSFTTTGVNFKVLSLRSIMPGLNR